MLEHRAKTPSPSSKVASEHAPGLISSRGSRDSFLYLASDKCALGECVCVVTFVAITTLKVSASQRMDGANDAEVGLWKSPWSGFMW